MYKIYKLSTLINDEMYTRIVKNPCIIDNMSCDRLFINNYKDLDTAQFYLNKRKGKITTYVHDDPEDGNLHDITLYVLYDNTNEPIEVSPYNDYVKFEREFRKLFTTYEIKNNVRIEYKFRGDEN